MVTAAGSEQNEFKRLSIFDPAARKFILEIYEDLGKHADFDGIHFHDDAFLSDFEDASPAALAYYSKQWKLPAGIENIRSDPGSFYTWSHRKADYLVDFTKELWKRTEKYCAPLLTSRNLYARVIMEKDSYQWFAQSHKLFLGAYDYTAIMAMPYMEKARDPMKWLVRLVREARKADPGLKHTLFELQSKNWNTGAPIPAALMVRQMELLQLEGALNFGYYPDDFIKNQPDLAEIRMGMSLQSYPYD